MRDKVRIIQYGLGPIGQACVRYVNENYGDRAVTVGAVDIDPEKTGRDAGRVCGLERDLGVRVSSTLQEAVSDQDADVVLHTTSSFLDSVEGQLLECLEAGLNVVSSTEELSYPWTTGPGVSKRLDDVARANNVSLLGTGVNPGFVMDTLALVASAVCARVDGIRIERVVDAGKRRLPLQRKIGAGMTIKAFSDRNESGGFGHVGLRESAQLVAAGLGWEVEAMEESIEPEIDERMLQGNGTDTGCVLGIRQRVLVTTPGKKKIDLLLRMYVGAHEPADTIEIAGDPPVTLTVPGGIFGDTATVAMLLNAVPRIVAAPPGLMTMLDLPAPRAFGGVTLPAPSLVDR